MEHSGWRRARLIASIVLGFATSASAWSQVPQAPEVVVAATRLEDSIESIAANASVITRDEIARSASRTLPEILGSRAGVIARDLFGNNGALATIDLRGFGAAAAQNSLILVDGRRLNDIDQSAVQWSSIPLDAVERIEILRGAGAVEYGDGASAGIINIVTRHPARDGDRASGAVRLGSWDSREITASANLFGEQAGLHAFLRNFESEGYRENNRNRQSNADVSGTWSGSAADATWRLALDREGLRLPGARRVQASAGVDEVASDPRGTSTPHDYAQRDGNQANLDLRWRAGSGELALGMGYRDKAQRSYFDFFGFPDYRDVDLRVLSLQPRFRQPGHAFGVKHTFLLGVDIARWDYALLRSNSAANVSQPANAVSATQDNDAVYFMDRIELTPHTSINLGARHERRRIEASDVYDASAPGAAFGSAAPAASETARAWAYEASLKTRVAADTAFIVRAVQSFRFANVDEVYEVSPSFTQQFQFLKPQRARTYELGVRYGQDAAWLRASLFHMDVHDEIRLDPFSMGVGNRNMPPLRRSGLETEAKASVGENLSVLAAYAYTQARFTEGMLSDVSIDGRTVPLVPRHALDIALDWRFDARTGLRAELHYLSDQFMDNDEGNTFGRKIPSRTTADLKLRHRAGGFTLSFGVSNLFDRNYYDYAVRSQFVPDRYNAYPLPERSLWIGVEYTGP